MSVVKSKRTQAKTEVFHHAFELRKNLTTNLLNDFGMKNKSVSDEDREKYAWFTEKEKDYIIRLLQNLVSNLMMARHIRPNTMAEYNERRVCQLRALGNCAQIFQELQYCITILPVNVNKYLNFVDPLIKEEQLIQDWIKADLKIKKRIKNMEK